jgi:hypothetical protein
LCVPYSGMVDGIEVRSVTPADAPVVTACLVRCYGDAYPKRWMYDAADLSARLADGRYRGVVATATGTVVGHIGFTRPGPAATVVQAGTTIVDPAHRRGGLMTRMAALLSEQIVAGGAAGFVHFPTTAHQVMQRASLRGGGCETGVLVGYLPGRLAVTAVYQPLAPAPPQAVHLPARYADLIAGLVQQAGLARTTRAWAPPAGDTHRTRGTDAGRGLARIALHRIGADVAAALAAELSTVDEPLVHVDLPLHEPGVDAAVTALRGERFAFGAWLPGWAGHDVLRMQRLRDATPAELAPDLYSAPAKRMMAGIRRELTSSG